MVLAPTLGMAGWLRTLVQVHFALVELAGFIAQEAVAIDENEVSGDPPRELRCAAVDLASHQSETRAACATARLASSRGRLPEPLQNGLKTA